MKCFKCGFTLSKTEILAERKIQYSAIDVNKHIIKKQYLMDSWNPFTNKLQFARSYLSSTKIIRMGNRCHYCFALFSTSPSFLINERSEIPFFINKRKKNKYNGSY